ncbi:restriction endonuclease subunit S [Bacillus altitudinis]|uniref:restriction endonuclease subunit S n=1 Tax=Bacillus altitudinis TaxID=293387 RepID=UPI0006A27082|nr:restriction endonuclease subunit S [Bacillus altitudinis]AKU30074.1 hypothetical protein ID12_00980 [Bacillus altitudinis]KAJ0074461.1 restriction endonuclease subunit S [Bacillus altitudinis]
MSDKITKSPPIRFIKFMDAWEQRKFGEIISERREKTKVENEDILLSSAIDGMYLNSELFSHFRGNSNIGYLKIRKNDMVLSTQNLHLGNCNINKRFEHGIISPAYKVYNLVDVDADFMHAWIKKDSTKQFFEKATTEGASVCRKNIEWGTLYNQIMYIPIYSEQQKIGAFFKQIDETITLHQRKLELLKDTKKSLLQKMFPKDGANVPEIRFAGFTDAWEHRGFSDVLDFSISNNTLSRAGLNYDHGEVKNIHYGDILVKFDSIVDINSEDVPWVTDGKPEDYKNQWLQNGDVIIADTAEDETTGKAIEVTGITNKYAVSGLHTMVARPNQEFAPKYLGYYLNSPAYHNKLLPLMQGIKVLSLSKANIAKTNVAFPKDAEEQAKIGSFFESIDNLITLHQRELNLLKDLKKSLLQQMFI